jgi:hypothetical protein
MELSDKRFTEIADRFGGFTFSTLQAFTQITMMLEKYGYTTDELVEYVEENKRIMNDGLNFQKDYYQGKIKMKTCPKCRGVMELESVNTCKGNMLPGTGYQSVYTCSRISECGFQIFNKNSIGMERYKHLKKNNIFAKYRMKKNRTHDHVIMDHEESWDRLYGKK